ncbi:MAG: hypothetical protein IPO39_07335 [Bacteroidetes bacterium]|nr:hypothetical protein [Bacteroidota bacterium]
MNLSGRWQAIFDDEAPESKMSVALFHQDGNHLTGTFLTTTGDYRYLEGEVSGQKVSLSAFDGSHAFLFTATIQKMELSLEIFTPVHIIMKPGALSETKS